MVLNYILVGCPCAFGPFQRGLLFGRFLTNFPWSSLGAPVILCLSNEGYFLCEVWKISLGPRFALFRKMRVLGDLAKIAITWPFGQFWSCFLRQNLLQSLHYKWMQCRDNHICARGVWPVEARATFWAIFEKLLLVSPFHFFWKCGFWVTFRKLL